MRALQLVVLGLERGAVAAKQAVEDAARIVLRRDRTAVEVVGNGAGAREIAGAGVDREDERWLAAELLGVQRDDLIESDGVVGAGLRVLQRGAREPHVGAGVRVGLGTVGMVEAAQEAELLAERGERLGRLAEDESRLFSARGEPTPLGDARARPSGATCRWRCRSRRTGGESGSVTSRPMASRTGRASATPPNPLRKARRSSCGERFMGVLMAFAYYFSRNIYC